MHGEGDRLERLRAAMAAAGLDGLVVSEPGNRRWLTGFTGSTGWPVVLADDAFLVTDSRYYEQVERQARRFRLERASQRPLERVSELVAATDARRVAVEREAVTLGQMQTLRDAAPQVDWVPMAGLVEDLRAIKTEEEIGRIRRAVDIGDRAVTMAYEEARPGITERELAWWLERFMRENGAEGLAFDIIVAAGENGSLPHHTPSDRPIAAGEPIVVDLGARVDGYNSDLTRTFSFGPASDPDYERVYGIVEQARDAAVAGIHAGMSGRAADDVARSVIRDAGYGSFFEHGLGHGVGLDVHEAPRLSPAADDSPLREAMVVTIEPGIYLPGRFGVRIEDLVVVRDSGVDVLSRAAKQPVLEPR